MRSRHLAISFFRKTPNWSGVPGLGSAPAASMLCAVAGSDNTCTRSAFTRAMMSGGTPLGATMPLHEYAS